MGLAGAWGRALPSGSCSMRRLACGFRWAPSAPRSACHAAPCEEAMTLGTAQTAAAVVGDSTAEPWLAVRSTELSGTALAEPASRSVSTLGVPTFAGRRQ